LYLLPLPPQANGDGEAGGAVRVGGTSFPYPRKHTAKQAEARAGGAFFPYPRSEATVTARQGPREERRALAVRGAAAWAWGAWG
jgi:hypothetical protein